MAGLNDELWSAADGVEFKADIREVMEMAMPNISTERPTFHFDSSYQWQHDDDAAVPFDLHTAPDSGSPRPDLQVLCLAEPITGLGAGMAIDEAVVGSFSGGRVRLTFFREEWEQVQDFVTVKIGGNNYERIRRPPTTALFNVDMISVEVRADDV